MIDSSTRDRIIETAQIVDVIQDFITLKKRGVNYLGLCPFHNEKTPSFTVSPSKGIYKCFGCGKGGNSVNFIMEHEQLSYPEALKYLAQKYGIEVEEKVLTEEEKKVGSERESLFIVTAFANRYFQHNLFNSQEGIEIGLSYFKERAFTEEVIKTFQLGYCDDKRDEFTQQALKNGYKPEYLSKSGLSIIKDDFKADRFSGRVIFPIFSISGKVIGFGGRTLKSDKKIAKYLNSPESHIYNKSRELYGLFQAKQDIVKKDKAFLVEGYTDVLSLHMSGIKNVVASSGTSLTSEQIRLIKRFTPNVTVLFDGDQAGIKASLRSIDMFLAEDMNVRVVLFPEGEDPDSFAKSKSNNELQDYINKNEEDFIRFKTKLLLEESKKDPVKRAYLITDIVRSLALIDDTIKRTIYAQECAEFLSIDENIIYNEIKKNKRSQVEKIRNSSFKQTNQQVPNVIPPLPSFIVKSYQEAQEKEIIRLLLMYGNHQIAKHENTGKIITVAEYIINELRNDQLEISNMQYQKIFNIIEQMLLNNEELSEKYFIDHPDPEISKISADLCSSPFKTSAIWKKRGFDLPEESSQLRTISEDVIIKYKLKSLQAERKEVTAILKKAKEENNTEEINNQMVKLNTLIYKISVLSAYQNRVILK